MSLNLCLDLGTAYSKAAAWTKDTNRPIPLRIGDAVGERSPTVPTTVLITRAGQIYFGEAAIREGASLRQPVFWDVKPYMTRKLTPLDKIAMPEEFNPSGLSLTVRQVASLYLAFLSRAAVESLRARNIVARDVTRTLTMPVFSGRQDAHSKRELGLATHLGWETKGAFETGQEFVLDLRVVLPKLRRLERRTKDSELDNMRIVEPLAAIAARMATYHPEREPGRRLSMVIDVGAGTVDFGMFVSGLKDDNIGVRPIARAKYSLPVGGNDIDSALAELILQKANLSGQREAEVKADLVERRRSLKEDLLAGYDRSTISVREAGVELSKRDFLSSDPLRKIEEEIERSFWECLRRIDASWFELAYNLDRNGIGVFLSGGGARLPFLRNMIPVNAPRTIHKSPQFYFRVAREDPRWATERGFVTAWRQIDRDYPQMAVSLGGAVYGAKVNQYLDMGNEVERWAGAMRR